MTLPRDIALILVRILAAYMLLQAISILPMSVAVGTVNPVMFLISHEFTTFVISTVLWFSAPWLASKIAKGSTIAPEPDGAFGSIQVETLIFSTVGVILIAVSIPQLVNMIAYNIAIDAIDDPTFKAQVIAGSKGFTGMYIAKIVVGSFLLLFSEKLCNLLARLRNKL